MKALRALFESLGYDDVTTYIQSGNVVFGSRSRSGSRIAAEIEHRFEAEFGFPVTVIVRTRAELAHIVKRNPFVKPRADAKQLHVALLSDAPKAKAIAQLDVRRSPPDEFVVSRREIYLRCPNGIGRSKLTNDYFERVLGTRATIRNWRTVIQLLTLAGSQLNAS